MPKPKQKKNRYDGNVAVPLDAEFKARLIERARREDRPVGQLARILLKDAFERLEAAGVAK